MTVNGVEITESRKRWIMAIGVNVSVQIGRDLTDSEWDQVIKLAVRHLAEPAAPCDLSMNWTELQAYANLVAQFYERNGRDPDEPTWKGMVLTARQMAAAPTTWLQ